MAIKEKAAESLFCPGGMAFIAPLFFKPLKCSALGTEELFEKQINNICTEPRRMLLCIYDGILTQCE